MQSQTPDHVLEAVLSQTGELEVVGCPVQVSDAVVTALQFGSVEVVYDELETVEVHVGGFEVVLQLAIASIRLGK